MTDKKKKPLKDEELDKVSGGFVTPRPNPRPNNPPGVPIPKTNPVPFGFKPPYKPKILE